MGTEPLKTVIIGSGPAGYTAAIYAARALLKPVLYTGKEPGGQLMITTDVENFPGYPDGVMGPQMMDDLKRQAERFDTVVKHELIERVDFTGPIHKIYTETGEEILAHTVIVSTGASARWLGLESEQRLMNHGVSACAVCDGFFYRGKETAIVGAGDSACEEALYLSNLCPTVHMLVRRDEMRASKIMQDRVIQQKNIKIYWNTEVEEILGDDHVTGVRVFNNQTGEKQDIAVAGFFIAIGHVPNTSMFKDWLDMESTGYLIHQPNTTKTNVPGVFVSGDAADHVYRQAITAAGTGCMAALDAERYLGSIGVI
ncbi:thioredoxin-disulfide reductase [Neolewinella lacunae]|uniref:Thioredoxin reductase n=1 Tax=Neolewinella lacunae TaxID=1517758 RepID=A0A923TCA0_9BACT|nr:thioredoxin-disulfide reductase [Neolewinella lacunae]MBC6993492.1 thioredoxin-disulfide reductase [Neolewinella lacunae]MDN3636232.1 thioredoxin-disulfide reductase [Neolewinella lacunae]